MWPDNFYVKSMGADSAMGRANIDDNVGRQASDTTAALRETS